MRMIKGGFGTLLVTYLLALVLMVMPMPAALDPFRPDWLALVLLYWMIALPHRVSMGTALVLGVVSDILLGSTFGIHATGLIVMGYFASRHFQKIRNFSLSQQALIVAILILLKRTIVFQVEHFLNDAQFMASYMLPVITSAIIWPWLFLLLRKVRRNFRVS
ncbi:rod shape-determining protein MreD [Pseudidiomarina planktonica]|uniref:Rod shape-determining protein MreD n=1 Tax=Pseudidiomarina planktonica TaxID=1323738 RepID=A0A1Y6ECV2_9GAMM|nr:rod shape-determining protein MreD [Pseudidiomarina planktonica]RUO66110.1 rod shape-determining protein MreD [Pseudidiomarina planktonica]SMQ60384.1 rod shape-determining protein MreD [Pseudidiomarina planktonica]